MTITNGSLSLNILFDAYVNTNAAASSLYPYLDRTPLRAIQVTTGARAEQGHDFALQLVSRYPNTEVVFRKLPDDSQMDHMSPQQWFDSYAPWAAGGKLTLYNTNEPGTGNIHAQDDWMAGTLSRAGKAGIKVVTWNLQTHNHFSPADIRQTLEMCAKYDHKLGLHYYFDNETGIPVDPVHIRVDNYCYATDIGHVETFISELGFAYMLDPNKGYQGHLGGKEYGAQLVKIAKQYPELMYFVFGWGNQSPYGTFDISGDKDVQDVLVSFNQESVPVNPTPPYLPGASPSPKLVNATAGLKLRTQPTTSSATIRVMPYQEAITVYAQPIQPNNGYNWQRVTDALGNNGWSANTVNGVPTWVDPAPVTPPQAVASIIDVSQYNGSINWAKLKMAGVTKAIIRSVIGITGEDSAWQINASSALAVGIKVSFYCIFEPQLDGAAQAQAFFHKHSFDDCWMSPAVDVELKNNCSPDQITAGLLAFVNEFKRLTGQSPTIYTGLWFWQPNITTAHDDVFGQCPLWIAAYQGTPPVMPHGWCSYALWQYSSTAVIDGNGSDHVDVSHLP